MKNDFKKLFKKSLSTQKRKFLPDGNGFYLEL